MDSNLKPGVSGVLIDYEHIRFGSPVPRKLLYDLYKVFFYKSTVSNTFKMGLVLPVFKIKGAKASNKNKIK